MKLYLDDDCASNVLLQLLIAAGHDAVGPAHGGLAGADDPVHLRHAVRHQRIVLTRNYRDFENLHDLILETRGHHPGILLIRKDNDPKRDMKGTDIVRAIQKLVAAGVDLSDQCVVLNHWR